MKVIFLDIDGVLNSRAYDRVRDYTVNSDIDESRMPLLKIIADRTDAVIVLSSTWRAHWEREKHNCDEVGRYIDETFEKFGLKIYDKTPDLGRTAERGKEVRAWLEANTGVTRFVILDDYRFGWDGLDGMLVKTNPDFGRGLEECHAERAIAILNAV